MNIISAVYQGLKRKKSAEAEAQRLGITVSYYHKIKTEIVNVIEQVGDKVDHVILKLVEANVSGKKTLASEEEVMFELEQELDRLHNKEEESSVVEIHENLEAGTSKITGITSSEPRSPEEIIRVLKIDTTKWKLSQFWNKEKGSRWIVSALVTRISSEEKTQHSFLELLEEYKIPKIEPLDPAKHWLNATATEKVCGVMSLQDLHFGKPGNEDMGKILNDSISYLIGKAHKNYFMEKIVLVVGPDTLNMDTFDGTTTKGTPVENSEVATVAYMKAFEALLEAIGTIRQFCEKLEVVFIPGNHDRLSSFHLLHALSQAFREWTNIEFNVKYSERKVLLYGKNMLCFEHGDVSTKNNPVVYAIEFPNEWGTTKHRMLYTGHYHGRKTTNVVTENEEHGFVTRILPALTNSDYYHYHHKYVGNKRSAILHIHDKDMGLVSEFIYNIN
jgi:hypothetical protein